MGSTITKKRHVLFWKIAGSEERTSNSIFLPWAIYRQKYSIADVFSSLVICEDYNGLIELKKMFQCTV